MSKLLIFITIVFASNLNAQRNLKEFKLKGKVKSIKTTNCRVVKEKEKCGYKLTQNFNKQGYLISQKSKHPKIKLHSNIQVEHINDTLTSYKTYKNDKLIATEKTVYHISPKKEIIIKYNDSGNLTSKIIKTKLSTDKEEEEKITFYKGKERERGKSNITYTLNSENIIVKKESKMTEGGVKGTQVITYSDFDEKGNWRKKVQIGKIMTYTLTEVFKRELEYYNE